MSYDYIIKFDDNNKFDIKTVLNACNSKPNMSFLLEVPNTIGLNADDFRKLPNNIKTIRIVGPYTDRLVDIHKGKFFKRDDGALIEADKDFYNTSLYNKNETIKILEEIQNIEKGIDSNWSDLQKVIYFYDTLKRNIFYDPKFETNASTETRSLKGLVSKKTVCAGYANIFQELLQRQGIKCHYILGVGHAWNAFEIDGKTYPIDLTWDNTRYRTGDFSSHSFFATNIEKFNKSHKTEPYDEMYNKENTYSSLNPNLVSHLSRQMSRNSDYTNTTYFGKRKDNSKYIVSQLGEATIDGEKYYRYYYVDVLNNGKLGKPLVLYGQSNIAKFINGVNFNKDDSKIPEINKINDLIDNVLLSRQNILDSLNKKTYFIGGIKLKSNKNKAVYINSLSELTKPKEKCDLFTYPTRRYTRSDGSTILVQCMNDKPNKVLDKDVNVYHVLELIPNENGKPQLKKNTIFSDSDLFNETRQEFADTFLSRERLDNIVSQTGGYVGTFNKFGAIEYNHDLAEYYDISKYVGTDGVKKKSVTPLPSFDELHDLVNNYEIVMDAAYLANPDGSLPKVCDKKTGNIITDKNTINKVYLASTWLSSAGVKYMSDDKQQGERYAFNNEARKLYDTVCDHMKKSVKDNGVIDTVNIFKEIDDETKYKHSREIVAKFFKTPMQVELLNQMTCDSLGVEASSKKPVALYTYEYAGSLAYGGQQNTM